MPHSEAHQLIEIIDEMLAVDPARSERHSRLQALRERLARVELTGSWAAGATVETG